MLPPNHPKHNKLAVLFSLLCLHQSATPACSESVSAMLASLLKVYACQLYGSLSIV